MRKLIFLLLLPALLWSCSSQDEPMLELPESGDQISYRTSDEISVLAQKAWSQFKGLSRANECTVKKVTPVKNFESRTASEPLLYAVEFEGEEGFVLVSSPTNVTPIIAYVEDGAFSPIEISEVPPFEYALQQANSFVEAQAVITPDPNPGLPLMPFERYDTITAIIAKAHVPVDLNQAWPENIYCPNKIAGCAPIALTHALTYFQINATYNITFSGATRTSITPNWSDIIKHKKSLNSLEPSQGVINTHYLTCSASAEAHDVLAHLVREIGHRMDADYRTDGTGTAVITSNTMSVSRSFLSSYYDHYIYSTYLFDELYKKEAIAIVRGQTNEPNPVGHAWVADGYLGLDQTVTYYEKEVKKWSKNEIVGKYIHHNWGWAGRYNAYIIDGCFDTEGEKYPYLELSPISRTEYNQNVVGVVFKK